MRSKQIPLTTHSRFVIMREHVTMSLVCTILCVCIRSAFRFSSNNLIWKSTASLIRPSTSSLLNKNKKSRIMISCIVPGRGVYSQTALKKSKIYIDFSVSQRIITFFYSFTQLFVLGNPLSSEFDISLVQFPEEMRASQNLYLQPKKKAKGLCILYKFKYFLKII